MNKLELQNAKLTPTAKTALTNIVYKAFSDRQTMYNAAESEKKEQILDQYKKAVGFDKLRDAYDKAKKDVELANAKVKEAETKILCKGLNSSGDHYTPSFYGNVTAEQRIIKKACDKVSRLLDVANNQSMSIARDKLISSLWCANTTYEAQALMATVLGNGEPLVNVTKIEYKQ